MGSDEDVVTSVAAVPERVFRGHEIDGGGNKSARVPNRGEAVHGAEVAGNVNGDEEKISFVRVKRANLALQQCPVDGNFRRE